MKKALLCALVVLLATCAFAQKWDTITASNASCVISSCVYLSLPKDTATVSVVVTGTFSATLTVESSADGGTTLYNEGTITAAGTYTYAVASRNWMQVRGSAYTSGAAKVVMNASSAMKVPGSVALTATDFPGADIGAKITAACTSVRGATVILPAGSYTMTSNANFANCNLGGMGDSTVVTLSGTAQFLADGYADGHVGNMPEGELHHIQVIGNGTTTNACIEVRDMRRTHIHHNTVTNCGGPAISNYGSGTGASAEKPAGMDTKNFTADHNVVRTNKDSAFKVWGPGGNENSTIEDNQCDSNSGYCVEARYGTSPDPYNFNNQVSTLSVQRNWAYANTLGCILLDGVMGGTIMGNNCGLHGSGANAKAPIQFNPGANYSNAIRIESNGIVCGDATYGIDVATALTNSTIGPNTYNCTNSIHVQNMQGVDIYMPLTGCSDHVVVGTQNQAVRCFDNNGETDIGAATWNPSYISAVNTSQVVTAFGGIGPRQNYLKYSETIDNAYWVKGANNTVTANYGVAPNNTTTAERVVTGASGDTSILASTNIGSNIRGNYTCSMWLKPTGASSATLLITVTSDTGDESANAYVTAAAGTWTRGSVTKNFTTSSRPVIKCGIQNSGQNFSKDYQMWGAQLVYGTTPGIYVQTVATPTDTTAAATPATGTVLTSPIVQGLPTSCTGQLTGTLWNNAGAAGVCP